MQATKIWWLWLACGYGALSVDGSTSLTQYKFVSNSVDRTLTIYFQLQTDEETVVAVPVDLFHVRHYIRKDGCAIHTQNASVEIFDPITHQSITLFTGDYGACTDSNGNHPTGNTYTYPNPPTIFLHQMNVDKNGLSVKTFLISNGFRWYYITLWALLGLVIFVGCCGFIVVVCRIGTVAVLRNAGIKRQIREQTEIEYSTTATPSSGPTSSLPEEYMLSLPHVPRSCVSVANQLGRGAFGEVYRGLAHNLPKVGLRTVFVAIKSQRPGGSSRDDEEFIKEALLMNSFEHRNIVRLLGVCMEAPPYWLLLELMEGGDLLSFLRDSRPKQDQPCLVSLLDLLRITLDVFEGCLYLEQQHHVHRDLAARNCLISTRHKTAERVVKIADFGLSRDVYETDYYRLAGKRVLLPFRWMAPESIMDGLYTVQTDVWSFGVLMWEVFTLGQRPYQALNTDEVIALVQRGDRLDKPSCCPPIAYSRMSDCWTVEQRPTFSALRPRMQQLANDAQMCSDHPYVHVPLPSQNHSDDSYENASAVAHD